MSDQPTPGSTGAGGDAGPQTPPGDQSTPDSTGDKDLIPKSEVERIVQARVASEQKKFADYEDLKKKADEFDKHQQAQMSELEKANQRAEAAEQREKERESELRSERTQNSVTSVASELKFINPSRAYKLLDTGDLEFGDDGRPTKDSVKKALEALAESDPYLVGQTRPSGDAGQGPRGASGSGTKGVSDMVREQVAAKRGTA